METVSGFRVSSNRLDESGTQNPWVQDELFIHYTKTSPLILRIFIVVYNV